MARPRKLTGRLYVATVIAAAVVIATLVNVISGEAFHRFDLTENNLNTLSPASKKAVSELDGLVAKVYISKDLPETIQSPQGGEVDLRQAAQTFRDTIEEYRTYADGLTVRFVEDDVVEKAKQADLRVFSGERAKAKEGRLKFREYALGATFHYRNAMEVFPLALQPERYEYEITSRLIRLREKVEKGKLMKDSLEAGKTVHEAIQACDDRIEEAEPKGDTQKKGELALLSPEASKARLSAYRKASEAIGEKCSRVGEALADARQLEGQRDALDRLLEVGGEYASSLEAFRSGLSGKQGKAGGGARGKAGPVERAQQLHNLSDRVEEAHQNLQDAPGRKSIGFVCAAGTFCPFPYDEPLVPRKMQGMMGRKNPLAGRMKKQIKQMEKRINRILRNVKKNLFEKRGDFEVKRVDLDQPVPDEIASLVLFGPTSELSDWQLYQIDQFLMNGGSVVVFLHPWTVKLQNYEADSGGRGLAQTLMGMDEHDSNVDELLAHWGLEPTGELVAQPESMDTMRVTSTRSGPGQLRLRSSKQVPYPLLPIFRELDRDNPLVGTMSSLTLPWATPLEIAADDASGDGDDGSKEGDGHRVTKLVRSTPRARSVSSADFPVLPQKQVAKVEEMEATGPHTVAALAQGTFDSYFADREVPDPPDGDEEGDASETSEPDPVTSGEGRLLVVGSNLGLGSLSREAIFEGFEPSMLTKGSPKLMQKARDWVANMRNWQVRLRQIQQTLPDNLRFLFNMLDWSVKKEELATIRAKQYRRRPLTSTDEETRSYARILGIGVPPLLFILIGVLRWSARESRKRRLKL